jgi:hypothetical protein
MTLETNVESDWNESDLCVIFQVCFNVILLLGLFIYVFCKFSWTNEDDGKGIGLQKGSSDMNNTIELIERRTGGAFLEEKSQDQSNI